MPTDNKSLPISLPCGQEWGKGGGLWSHKQRLSYLWCPHLRDSSFSIPECNSYLVVFRNHFLAFLYRWWLPCKFASLGINFSACLLKNVGTVFLKVHFKVCTPCYYLFFFFFMFSFEELRCSTRKVLHPRKFVDCLCDSVNRFLFCTSCRLVRRPRDLLRLMPVPMATLKGTLKVWWWYVSAVMGVSTQRRASLLVASGGGRV